MRLEREKGTTAGARAGAATTGDAPAGAATAGAATAGTARGDHADGPPWGAVLAVISAMCVFSLMMGLSYPLLSLILERQGVSEGLIGLNAAMLPLGIVVSSAFVPGVAARLGAWRTAVLSLVASILCLALIGLWQDMRAWFLLRFLLGLSMNTMHILGETWINQLATAATRGRILGIYATVLAAGFGLGPILLWLTGSEGLLPFAVACGAAALAFLPLVLWRRRIPPMAHDRPMPLKSFLPLAPVLLAIMAALALYDQALLSLLPIYGLRQGMGESAAALALAVCIAGQCFLQYPIGWLADRVSRRLLTVGCASVTVLGCLLLPVVVGTPLLWPMLFFWGGITFGLYTLSMTELGAGFSGSLLLAGTAAVGAMWGLGGLMGPPVAGTAMQALGPDGFPLALAAVFGLLALVVAWRGLTPGGA